MSRLQRWIPGSPIVYREVWRGKVWTARSVSVVQDAPDLIVLFFHAGTRWKKPIPLDPSTEQLRLLLVGNWQLVHATWKWDSLILIHPGEAHAVHVMRGDNREFLGWYINLQEPLRRTAIGFDFMDHALDIVVKPDLSAWVWKDEDHFQWDQEVGLISSQEVREIRAEGGRVIERIRTRASPFNEGWENWFPPPEWPSPDLPKGWDQL